MTNKQIFRFFRFLKIFFGKIFFRQEGGMHHPCRRRTRPPPPPEK